MFGAFFDYWMLRPFTHSRNAASEEELDIRRREWSPINVDVELHRVEKLQDRLQGHLPVSPHLRYLDIGCGEGGMTLALAALGAKSVTGVDVVPRNIKAAVANSEQAGLNGRVKFLCEDIHNWSPPHRYDVVLSHEALEHILEPDRFLAALDRFVRPSGIVVLAFGPLFFSPFGDHMDAFFRVPIPWRGALFSEASILRLRRERFRLTDRAESYRGITGGLNLLRYSEFLTYVERSGWKFDFLDINPQLRKWSPLYRVSRGLCEIPLVRDYLASSVYAVLRRRDATHATSLRT